MTLPDTLVVDELYSNDEIIRALHVSNTGGIRVSVSAGQATRGVIITSLTGVHNAVENPYRDGLEGNILTYTAAGKVGEQTLSGMNIRLTQQRERIYPIHGFSQIASRRSRKIGPKRWQYLGLLEYLRHYPDMQVDIRGEMRQVWLFEFRVHTEPRSIPLAFDARIADEILTASRLSAPEVPEDNEIVSATKTEDAYGMGELEAVRRAMLTLDPRQFEFFVKRLLEHCGYDNVCVTKYSSDGGIDVNATTGSRIWIFEKTLVQVQAKRWIHSVGRKEVAELRGSLRPFARGTILTTGHFSRAAPWMIWA